MTYAVISDIHGNLPAFTAVLADAKANGATNFLFLGDYVTSFPYENEIVDLLRGIDNAVLIRGNHEDYLIHYAHCEQTGQPLPEDTLFSPIYNTYRILTPKNKKYLCNLPEKAQITESGHEIFLMHLFEPIYRSPSINVAWKKYVEEVIKDSRIFYTEYRKRIRENLLSRPDRVAEVMALPEGLYLFGDSHIQFHINYENRLMVNPGACGFAVDGDTTAAYTLLTYRRSKNAWTIMERRVVYDINETIERMEHSGFADRFPLWYAVYKQELLTGFDAMVPIVTHIKEVKKRCEAEGVLCIKTVWDIIEKEWFKGSGKEYFKRMYK